MINIFKKNNSNNFKSSSGFSAVELLVTLFVAAAFLMSGYQLYAIVIKDGGKAHAQASASNTAYDYIQRYKASATNPCTAQTPLTNSSIAISGVFNPTITVAISCPYGTTSSVSKVLSTINYDTPQQTITNAIFVNQSPSAPTEPTSLTATGGSGQIALNWVAPANNGGTAITGYRIYRGSTANSETTLTTVGNVITYTDTSLANNTTYYYKVAAINSVGEGALSGEVSKTSGIAASAYIQTITTANCPSTRTQVQDARDGHTYWIQKLADNKCWMLTNLGYAGGGTNTYGDTKTLTNGTGDGSKTFTVAKYYVTPATTNFTTEPTAPSTSTTGTGQYGYLYNWCAATGGDLASSGCSSTITTPLPVTTASICPAGWRLPTGGSGGEFTALNTAVNGDLTNTDAGLIAAPWLAQRGGYWNSGFSGQGSNGVYWSSTQYSATYAYNLSFYSTIVVPANNYGKNGGFAVRCVAI